MNAVKRFHYGMYQDADIRYAVQTFLPAAIHRERILLSYSNAVKCLIPAMVMQIMHCPG